MTDVVVGGTRPTTPGLATLKGNGDGTFGSPIVSSVAEAIRPVDVGLADFNGDGRADLISRSMSFRTFEIGISDGAGDFTMTSMSARFSAQSIHHGDFNNDGSVDVVIGTSFGGAFVYFNDGSGGFAVVNQGGGRLPTPIVGQPIRAAQDLNGDGNLDFVETSRFNSLSVGTGDGASMFSIETYIAHPANPDWPAQATPDELNPLDNRFLVPDRLTASADFDGDGRTDIVSVTTVGNYNSIRVLRGGPNAFRGQRYASGEKSLSLELPIFENDDGNRLDFGMFEPVAVTGDFNNDGVADVVYASSTSDTFNFCAGRGDGTFADPTDEFGELGDGTERYTLVAEDFDQDGNLDLLVPQADFNYDDPEFPEFPEIEELFYIQSLGGVVLWGLGDGSFERDSLFEWDLALEPGALSRAGIGPEMGVAAGDVNGDGFPDFALSLQGFLPMIHLYDPGNPREFKVTEMIDPRQQGIEPFNYTHRIAGGDLNNDGLTDFVLFNGTTYDPIRFPESLFLAVLLSDGDGTFTRVIPDFSSFTQGQPGFGPPANYQLSADVVEGKIIDVNGDQRADLVFTHAQGVYLMTGDGTGMLSAPRQLLSANLVLGATALQVTDLIGDSRPEIIANVTVEGGDPRNGGGSATVILPNIGGSDIFGTALPVSVGMGRISSLLSIDSDRDGKNDLLAMTSSSNFEIVEDGFVGIRSTSPFAILIDPISGTAEEPGVDGAGGNGATPYFSPPGDFTTLVRLQDGTWERRTKNGAVFLFDALGRQISAQDQRGRKVTYAYVGDTERVSMITDAGGRQVTFNYSGNMLSSVTTPAGVLTMRYDEPSYVSPGAAPWSRLTSVTSPGGAVRRFTYGTQESNR